METTVGTQGSWQIAPSQAEAWGDPGAGGARELGSRGEDAAVRSLERRGWEVVERNWRCQLGEVDIVARDPDGQLALVEVKTRSCPQGAPDPMPELAVDDEKARRYVRLAGVYGQAHPEVGSVRFDVIAITATGDGHAHLRHISNAFCGGM